MHVALRRITIFHCTVAYHSPVVFFSPNIFEKSNEPSLHVQGMSKRDGV